MIKKISTLSILFLMFFVNSLLANTNDYKNYKIAIRPLNFDPNYDTYIEEIIVSVLTDNGLNVFNRNKKIDEIIDNEYKDINENNPEAKSIDKSIITHVVSGNIIELNGQYICSLSIKNIGTYKSEKSVTKVLYDLSYDNVVRLASSLYEEITGYNVTSPYDSVCEIKYYKTSSVSKELENNINIKKKSRVPAMVTGILFLASGLAGTIYSTFELVDWHSEIGGSAANEYYLYKNPNSSLSGSIQYRKLTLYNAWKKGEINTKPDNMPYFNPVGSSIMLGSSIALTIIGLGLFGWSLSDQDTSYSTSTSSFNITPTIFDENGLFDMGVQMAFSHKL
ncbi:hypothetical protein [Brachyspira alvinipulli]|uniref:hypothetical protein n=1 Tax=Brachyspira alvinipulli TaxID=84379 RepID=UPI000482CF1F|nr:hypothetical protein [Brachyspira alvinipulli]